MKMNTLKFFIARTLFTSEIKINFFLERVVNQCKGQPQRLPAYYTCRFCREISDLFKYF